MTDIVHIVVSTAIACYRRRVEVLAARDPILALTLRENVLDVEPTVEEVVREARPLVEASKREKPTGPRLNRRQRRAIAKIAAKQKREPKAADETAGP